MANFFITCSKGLAELVGEEATAVGLTNIKAYKSGVRAQGDVLLGYAMCIRSRFASRVLLEIDDVDKNLAGGLYNATASIVWGRHIKKGSSLYIIVNGKDDEITNTQYGAQLAKDAICDQLLSYKNFRPDIDKNNPDLRLHIYLNRGRATFYIDFSGESLSKRGYRTESVEAPLGETVAAAMVHKSGFFTHLVADKPVVVIDPFCGSGTLLIEAAMQLTRKSPGLYRKVFGFHGWSQFDADVYESERQKAQNEQVEIHFVLCGYDKDDQAIRITQASMQRAGFVQQFVGVRTDIKKLADNGLINHNMVPDTQTLVVANPPYGVRLGDEFALRSLYFYLGQLLKRHLPSSVGIVISPSKALISYLNLRAEKKWKIANGPLDTEVLRYKIGDAVNTTLTFDDYLQQRFNDSQKALINRLIKKQKQLNRWADKQGTNCYRWYDADIPEYSFAIDIYGQKVVAYEYAAPKHIPVDKTEKHREELLGVLHDYFNYPRDAIHLKQRTKQKGNNQYIKQDKKESYENVAEGPLKFSVNLDDYLDTGLFLDNRIVRQWIGDNAADKTVLNLFCYTASASVYAAKNGATKVTSVDLSKNYLTWAKRNFRLNQIDVRPHQFVEADVVRWLSLDKSKYDVILLDPPTFSNSKKTTTVLDIQRDHLSLIDKCMDRLAESGLMYFTTNCQKFKLSEAVADKYNVSDLTRKSTSLDFEKAKNRRYCWMLKHRRQH